MYKILLNKVVDKFLKKHKNDKIIDLFEKALNELSKNPLHNNLDITKLQWYDFYRLKIWDYRFIYEILEEEIIIIFIDAWNRWDIYKKYK